MSLLPVLNTHGYSGEYPKLFLPGGSLTRKSCVGSPWRFSSLHTFFVVFCMFLNIQSINMTQYNDNKTQNFVKTYNIKVIQPIANALDARERKEWNGKEPYFKREAWNPLIKLKTVKNSFSAVLSVGLEALPFAFRHSRFQNLCLRFSEL